jgi:hypothetical protein
MASKPRIVPRVSGIEKSEFSKRNKLALVWFVCREGMEAAGYFRRRPGFRPRTENAWAALPRSGAGLSRLHDGLRRQLSTASDTSCRGTLPGVQEPGRRARCVSARLRLRRVARPSRVSDRGFLRCRHDRSPPLVDLLFGLRKLPAAISVTLQPDFVAMLYRLHIDRTKAPRPFGIYW